MTASPSSFLNDSVHLEFLLIPYHTKIHFISSTGAKPILDPNWMILFIKIGPKTGLAPVISTSHHFQNMDIKYIVKSNVFKFAIAINCKLFKSDICFLVCTQIMNSSIEWVFIIQIWITVIMKHSAVKPPKWLWYKILIQASSDDMSHATIRKTKIPIRTPPRTPIALVDGRSSLAHVFKRRALEVSLARTERLDFISNNLVTSSVSFNCM